MEEVENKIQELEERIEKLEKRERNRKVLGIVKSCFSLLLFAAVIFAGIKFYQQIMDEIAPYKEIVDSYTEFDMNDLFNKWKGKK